jgi:hypothetical protein
MRCIPARTFSAEDTLLIERFGSSLCHKYITILIASIIFGFRADVGREANPVMLSRESMFN